MPSTEPWIFFLDDTPLNTATNKLSSVLELSIITTENFCWQYEFLKCYIQLEYRWTPVFFILSKLHEVFSPTHHHHHRRHRLSWMREIIWRLLFGDKKQIGRWKWRLFDVTKDNILWPIPFLPVSGRTLSSSERPPVFTKSWSKEPSGQVRTVLYLWSHVWNRHFSPSNESRQKADGYEGQHYRAKMVQWWCKQREETI